MPKLFINRAPLTMNRKDPIHLMLYEGAFFAFKNDTIGLQGLYRMPHAFRDIHAISPFLST